MTPRVASLIPLFLDEVRNPLDAVFTVDEVGAADDFLREGDGRLDAIDLELGKSTFYTRDGDGACGSGNDEFGNHRVVVRLLGISFWCEVLEGAGDGIGEGRTGVAGGRGAGIEPRCWGMGTGKRRIR